MSDLNGQLVLVTGASRGIGEETARQLVAAGAKVILAARSLDKLQSLADELGDAAEAVALDLSKPSEAEAVVQSLVETYGPIDALINNAGMVEPIGAPHEVSVADFSRCLEVNLTGAFAMVKAVLPSMLAAGKGSIINISSGAAHNPLEGWSAYCASKAGLAMLTRSLDLEYREKGLRIIGFGPGVVDTEMQVQIRASGINQVSQLKRTDLAPASRPAQAVCWLLTDAAADLAGQELSIGDEELQRRCGLAD